LEQKALTQMNLQLADVLSDVSGVTGQAIIKAILRGERDPQKLAALRDLRVKASEAQIAQSLQGNWQPATLAGCLFNVCEPRLSVSSSPAIRSLVSGRGTS
jgi:hypothetical protein